MEFYLKRTRESETKYFPYRSQLQTKYKELQLGAVTPLVSVVIARLVWGIWSWEVCSIKCMYLHIRVE